MKALGNLSRYRTKQIALSGGSWNSNSRSGLVFAIEGSFAGELIDYFYWTSMGRVPENLLHPNWFRNHASH
jgi:hypothetical protein